MRRNQKEQIIQFIDVLKKAYEQLNHLLVLGDGISAQKLLMDCQEGAIAFGTMVEQTEGEGHATVQNLEVFCEIIFQLHESISRSDMDGISGAQEKMMECLDVIEKSVQNDIKVRVQKVFLPYKASMWDSLESVWKAAKEDPDCDSYVIPIPYYSKGEDGSLKEMHYEGNEFPSDVPIVHYEEFDFGSQHPDEIYIHNPYDEMNFVTSVHPFFYSKNLKKYTDSLVYIPYFVLAEVDPQNENALTGLEHFVKVPGVINADKVIVQSEQMKKAYVNILTKFAGENTRPMWEQKISGAGSPKIDKILCACKEEQNIPAEWMEKIQKTDGTWKKIVLYNTSVAAFLSSDDKMLAKIERVLKLFYQEREKVVLLWRPHPLMRDTIRSMRPDLLDAYDEIVLKYKSADWGIYDDTADMDRAIIISDAYYGDASSLVQLCQKAKKPIMIQNVNIP